MSSHTIGEQAENIALAYLQKQGLVVVSRNYRSYRGEIDLIMQDDTVLVFIEIRYRKSAKYGSALESINAHKQSRIIHTAQSYIQKTQAHYDGYRFDVVTLKPDNGKVGISWIKHAFALPS